MHIMTSQADVLDLRSAILCIVVTYSPVAGTCPMVRAAWQIFARYLALVGGASPNTHLGLCAPSTRATDSDMQVDATGLYMRPPY